MRLLEEIENDIALLREELNIAVREEVRDHVPTNRLLEMSKKMDELLVERENVKCCVR